MRIFVNSATSRALQDSPGSFVTPAKRGREDPNEELESPEELDIVQASVNSSRSAGGQDKEEGQEEEDSTESPDLPKYIPQVTLSPVKDEEETGEIEPLIIDEIDPAKSEIDPKVVETTLRISEIDPTESPTQELLSVYSPEEAPSIEDQKEDNLTTEAGPSSFNDRVSITFSTRGPSKGPKHSFFKRYQNLKENVFLSNYQTAENENLESTY